MWSATAWGQTDYIVLQGRVTSDGGGVPYASLMLSGTTVGVSCNDNGDYELKLREEHAGDTVVVRSVGYETVRVPVAALRKNGRVRMKRHLTMLREVKVKSYRNGRQLLQAVVSRIDSNYHRGTAYSTFFYRDWRAIDGEMFLFDEAVMYLQRAGYQKYARKRSYKFDPTQREMATNYKTVVRHRLVVNDRGCLEGVLDDPKGIDEMMEFSDNESFFDPVATPQASYAMARNVLGWHKFEPLREFESDGTWYYSVRSEGPCHMKGVKVRYEWTIRKDNLAIERLTAAVTPSVCTAPAEAWVNGDLTHRRVVLDTSAWVYSRLDGAYTLTRYYHSGDFTLGRKTRREYQAAQHWQMTTEWTLTGFSVQADTTVRGVVLQTRPQTLAGAFGESDYTSHFWGPYNSIVLDTLPARLLTEKMEAVRRKTNKTN